MDGALNLFTAFGLSTSAGLNAYLPLLLVALLSRFTDLITLESPWNVLESWWIIGLLTVLLLIELFVDKVPALDTANDVLQTVIRPVAGAVLFAASSGVVTDVHPVLALVLGLLTAGGVHAVKATARPVVTGATAGTMNPVVSTLEDILSLLIAILAILLPLLGIVLLVVLLILLLRWRRRRRRQQWAES